YFVPVTYYYKVNLVAGHKTPAPPVTLRVSVYAVCACAADTTSSTSAASAIVLFMTALLFVG
ncbi:MAG: hypothetical protein MZW92_68425, partial [Comamonadaceae bacterium]|nr:hypothetical protein [Comamonadaceae bacterium]